MAHFPHFASYFLMKGQWTRNWNDILQRNKRTVNFLHLHDVMWYEIQRWKKNIRMMTTYVYNMYLQLCPSKQQQDTQLESWHLLNFPVTWAYYNIKTAIRMPDRAHQITAVEDKKGSPPCDHRIIATKATRVVCHVM